jgi:hypothetical protein
LCYVIAENAGMEAGTAPETVQDQEPNEEGRRVASFRGKAQIRSAHDKITVCKNGGKIALWEKAPN